MQMNIELYRDNGELLYKGRFTQIEFGGEQEVLISRPPIIVTANIREAKCP